ncbi:bifunctional DNA primase/polymerase, partial [Enterococcus faecium]|uniref:bifunctional DNA primase/polymerase n=1 Tax=Enterococcus faecium TaxID=1352 RepID=UPI0034E96245
KSLEEAGLEIPETFNYETKGGGRHYVYAAPEGIELTIARGLVYQGKPLDGIDVRSGSGLFVYYGGEVTKRDVAKLAPAPDWLLVTRERPAYNGGQDAAPSADESAFRARLADGKPPKDLRDLIRGVEFPSGGAHDVMLETVTALVSEGVKGRPGIAALMDETRERYVGNHPDR